MDTAELLRANLALVERLVRFVCQRARVVGADVDDFDATVKLALVDNDYAVLRAWEGRSSLVTYLTVIIRRLLIDERNRTLGRWRPSAEAKRLGEKAVLIEALLRRDQRSIDETTEIARAFDASLTEADVEAIAAKLPDKTWRPRAVEMPPDMREPQSIDRADARAIASELETLSQRTSRVIGDCIAALPIRDRMLLRLHFVKKMSIADTARILQVPQRPLYRRLEQILKLLREALTDAGIDARTVGDLIGSAVVALDFGLGSGKFEAARQSNGQSGQEGGLA